MLIYWQSVEARPVLKPAEFQDFELTEKTIITHNVAMYVYYVLSSPVFIYPARKHY